MASAFVIPALAEHLHRLLGVVAELRLHRLLDDRGEAVAAGVPLLDELLDDPADVAEGLADLAGVLAGELDDLDRVPDDVVLADRLEPERRDADRALPTSEFQTKKPGANASPSISAQPVGSIRKQNMSCSPQ